MAATYSGDPSSSLKDEVRFLIGDTDMSNPEFSDEEIEFALSDWDDNPYLTAAQLALTLSSKYSSAVSISGDGLSWSGGNLSQKYADLYKRLLAQYRRKTRAASPYAGGLSKAERIRDDNDADLVKGAFRIGMDDYPGTGDVYDDEDKTHE